MRKICGSAIFLRRTLPNEKMFAIYKILFLISIWCAVSKADEFTRTEEAQCYKNTKDNTLTTYFKSVLNDDEINYLFGMKLMPGSDPPMYTKSTDCDYTLSDGVLSVSSTVDLADPSQSENKCGFVEKYSDDAEPVLLGFTWMVSLRNVESYYFSWPDAKYKWTCNIASATDTWLVAEMEVIGPNDVTLTPLTPTISFYVIKDEVDEPIDSCTAGELLQLQIKLEVSGYKENLMPWGLYSYDTMVNSEANFDAASNPDRLIKTDGCYEPVNVLDLMHDFTIADFGLTGTNDEDLVFLSRTGTFRCRKYPDKNMLHFITTVGVCFGKYEPQGQQDKKCIDFCQFGARRRRETPSRGNYTEMVTTIRVIDERERDKQTGSGSGSTTILIIAPIVGVLVLLTSVLGVTLCCWANRRNAIRKRRFDSRTSSESSIPVKY